MQRAPAVIAFLLFLALCASIAYWLLQWMAPPPRPVAAPPQAARALPPVAAAANLFGGGAKAAGMANVQLKGIIRAASPQDSSAIIAVEGKPARALQANAEVTSGLTVKAIHARSVVLSDRGAERELSLPAFAAQEGAMSNAPGRSPESPQAMPPMPQASPPPQIAAPPQATGPSTGATSASGGSAMPSAQPVQAGQHPLAISPQPTQKPAQTQ
jgi:general secretion pathway protein C